MSLENRIDRLEKTGVEVKKPCLVIVGSPGAITLDEAKADYKREHPDYQGEFNTIWVGSQQARAYTLRLIAGERTTETLPSPMLYPSENLYPDIGGK